MENEIKQQFHNDDKDIYEIPQQDTDLQIPSDRKSPNEKNPVVGEIADIDEFIREQEKISEEKNKGGEKIVR